MLNPLDLVKPYLTYALLAFAAAGWAACGWQYVRAEHAERGKDKIALAWANDRDNATALALKTQGEYRTKEASDRANIQAKQEAYANLQTQHAATLAAHRATDGKLRDQLAAFARGSSTRGDSCAATSATAEAYGVLLANGLRVQEELARGAESSSDAVRTLEASWPTAKPR